MDNFDIRKAVQAAGSQLMINSHSDPAFLVKVYKDLAHGFDKPSSKGETLTRVVYKKASCPIVHDSSIFVSIPHFIENFSR